MAIPTARVKVEITQITGLPSIILMTGATRYLRCTFITLSGPLKKKRFYASGRSSPIPAAGGTFDPAPEKTPWVFEANLNPGESIWVEVITCEDRGDLAPPPPVPLINLLHDVIDDPWTSGDRTVGMGGVSVKLRVTTTLINPTDKAFLARAASSSKKSGTLTMPQGYYVEITDILGLYQPNPTIATGTPGSQHVVGYLSEDNLGRIFTNRTPDGTWASGKQYIDVQVKVTAFGGATLPAGVQADWTIEDVDDPTNEDRNFHRDWGRYVDANDYDAAGKPIGAHPGDNASAFSAGNTNDLKLFGSDVGGVPPARWAQATSGPIPNASSLTQATTDIDIATPQTGTTSVRIHCMNVGGTNLLLRVGLTGTPAAIPVFGASTGIMTMWSRIDVQVVRMAGAHSLSGALVKIPPFFLPACVQMDFHPETPVTLAPDPLASSDQDAVFDAACIAWVDNASVFTHKLDHGWFFLGAAMNPYPLPPSGSDTKLIKGIKSPDYTFTDPFLEVKGSAPTADSVKVTWEVAFKQQHTTFMVNRKTSAPPPVVAGGKTKMRLWPNDVTPLFTGDDADGSTNHAMQSAILYFPQSQTVDATNVNTPGGFKVPDNGATIDVSGPGAVATSGVSPTVTDPATPDIDYFAGRTIIFTHTDEFSDGGVAKDDFVDLVIEVVVHEFTHAFGMPHKCGYWNWRTPRLVGGHSCCMNYFSTWLVDDSFNLLPNTVGKGGNDMCGRHLMEIRRVHLDRNKGLWKSFPPPP